MKPEVLVMVPPQGVELAGFGGARKDFELHYAPDIATANQVIEARGPHIRAVITTGSFGITAEQIGKMPKLEIVQTRGMGYEKLDIETAKKRGIVVANSPSVNFFAVAEHAVCLLLTLVRDVQHYNTEVHAGRFEQARALPARPLVHGKTIGILGLGDIGASIARRVTAFDAKVVYHNRNKRTDVDYPYYASLVDMAKAVDILVVSCPGGAGTRHLVNAEVLEALGPQGFLVNVGRGTVVSNAALVDALVNGKIRGAAVDVIEGEPEVPEDVLKAPNLIITPHIAANAPESRQASVDNTVANVKAHLAGQPIRGRLA